MRERREYYRNDRRVRCTRRTFERTTVRSMFFSCLLLAYMTMTAGDMNQFEGTTDVGRVQLPGSVQYDSVRKVYRIAGSGENMWGNKDAFFFLWRKVNGDVTMKTTITWEGKGKNPHRKAGGMIRAGLEPDAPYVDAVLHGDGLISLQYRKTKGDVTAEVQSPLRGAASLVLERHGNQAAAAVIGTDGLEHPIATITLELPGDLYAGLATCSHDSTVSETALFSDVRLDSAAPVPDEKRVVESTLEILDVASGARMVVRRAKEHFEAPNWSPDGELFYYNSGGRLFTLPVTGGTPRPLPTGFADKCNNDHGLSPNGQELVISHHGKEGKSLIYILPSSGGEPRQVTPLGPSYWHGWSPDGKTLAYCAERNGEFDVYTIPVQGGEEKRLTAAPGLDDGPEYSHDGRYIYFNSVRTGQMKIWRMNADGSDQTQFTPNDNYGDWF